MSRRRVIPTPDRTRMLPDDFPAKFIGVDIFEKPAPIDMSGHASSAIPFYVGLLSLALRPMFGEPRPLFVSGGDFRILDSIATSLGMPVMTIRDDADVKRILDYNALHRWPILVFGAFERESMYIQKMQKAKSGFTVFYLDDAEQARLAARFHSDSEPIILSTFGRETDQYWQELQSPPDPKDELYWQDRLPVLATVFFLRLAYHAQNRPRFHSPKTFFLREKAFWMEYFRSLAPSPDGP